MSDPARLTSFGIPKRFRSVSFDSYEELSPALSRARLAVERWAESYPDVKKGLFLTGQTGVGKTHLAVAAVRRVALERNLETAVRFVCVPALIERLRFVLRDGSATEDAILAPLFRAEILVLDGLGEDMVQEWVVEKMLYLLTRCYNDCQTLICTSVYREDPAASPALADRISPRGVSMLLEACQFVEVQGEDFRHTVIRHGE